jgi:hypothetical protein
VPRALCARIGATKGERMSFNGRRGRAAWGLAIGLAVAGARTASGDAVTEAATQRAPFGWLAELAGSCWLGTDAAGQPTDRQCYWQQYAFLRGSIEIFAGSATGKPAYTGDSLFAWDAAASDIGYDYWASTGHAGRARARFEGERLVFPPADEGDGGRPRIRSTWERLDTDSFRVVREHAEAGGEWREVQRVVYRRENAGKAPDLRAAAPARGGPLDAFAFLGDSCWVGTFANGKTKDENCFEWTLGGRFLRSRHRVVDGEGPYEGETLFGFDATLGRPTFVYWNSLGGVSRGSATAVADGVDFADEKVEMGGKTFTLRSTWRRHGDDRFVALTEREADGSWQPMMRIEFARVGPSPSAPEP